jgi:hypothetical protein
MMATAVAAGMMQTRVALVLERPLLMNRFVLEIIMYIGNFYLHGSCYGFELGTELGTSPADEQAPFLEIMIT